MAESHCISALVDKRSEIAGEIEEIEAQLSQRRADLLHIDATIRIMQPDYKPEEIRPKKRYKRGDWFGNGELLRLILETLRKAAGEAMTAKEVALVIMERKGFDIQDDTTVRLVEKRVFAALDRRKGSVVQRIVYGPKSVGWRV